MGSKWHFPLVKHTLLVLSRHRKLVKNVHRGGGALLVGYEFTERDKCQKNAYIFRTNLPNGIKWDPDGTQKASRNFYRICMNLKWKTHRKFCGIKQMGPT